MPITAPALKAVGVQLRENRQIRDLGARVFGGTPDDAPGPCVGCPHATRCGPQRLACEQFAAFVRLGGPERWRAAARQPSAAIFARLFEGAH
jgi:hypothetical protein